MRRRLLSVMQLLSAALVLGLAFQVSAAQKSEAWPYWTAQDRKSTKQVDHSDWQAFLDKYLDSEHASGIYRIDYSKVSADDTQILQSYLNRLTGMNPRKLSRKEQLPYWINLYNALTVKVVLDAYPVDSILSIRPTFFSIGPWDKDFISIHGHNLSLNDIEHRILRPIWQDPRIHYAGNCASLGCPNIAAQAYTADNAESLLDQGCKDYVNHPRGVRFTDDELMLSSIYDWYAQDFGDQKQLLGDLASCAEPELATQLNAWDGKIDYEYDCGLNKP